MDKKITIKTSQTDKSEIFFKIEFEIFLTEKKKKYKIGSGVIQLSDELSKYKLYDLFWEFDSYIAAGEQFFEALFAPPDEFKKAYSELNHKKNVWCKEMPKLLVIDYLLILPEYQGMGIGSKVLSILENKYGCERIKVLVAAPMNPITGRNYDGLDFDKKRKMLNRFYRKNKYKVLKKIGNNSVFIKRA